MVGLKGIMTRSRAPSGFDSVVGVTVTLWFVITLVIGATGLLARVPLPPPAIAFVLAAALLLLLRLSPAARERVERLGPGPLVAFHLVTRLAAGIYFLVLFRRGALPGEFALPAGWGDVLVAVGAGLVLWLCLPVRNPTQRHGLLVWNVFGLLDILMVLGNAARLFFGNRAFAEPFAGLPLALLPLFVVPIVLASHVLLFRWAGRSGAH
jgi:hypothetical protein